MNDIRVRFAPSPTGPLHIGGVRTALYNYLFAKKHRGTFILRIEDTDQKRYVANAESYIKEALSWLGMEPDEGPFVGGKYGPYRQSERKELYQSFVKKLIDNGSAYYAFDSQEDLKEMRKNLEATGVHSPKYDHNTRKLMKNSLTLDVKEVDKLLKESKNITVRLKVPKDEIIDVYDLVRGMVSFDSNELDDKVLLKADGMPTYHMANIVDDYLMQISHVIRGEEWLSSTAHHVLLYRALAIEESMPKFAHLPLILKPNGKGKLSKRDGAKFGFPVFPLVWQSEDNELYEGFREQGYLPEAVLNFLALLGWNPGTEQEIFDLDGLTTAFDIPQISKSGAKFDFQKAKWFNQQYIAAMSNENLAKLIEPNLIQKGYNKDFEFLVAFCNLMKERVTSMNEFAEEGKFLLQAPDNYDQKAIKKKFNLENLHRYQEVNEIILNSKPYTSEQIKKGFSHYINDWELNFGEFFTVFRVGVTGIAKGPNLFQMIELLGKKEFKNRMERALKHFKTISQN